MFQTDDLKAKKNKNKTKERKKKPMRPQKPGVRHRTTLSEEDASRNSLLCSCQALRKCIQIANDTPWFSLQLYH